MRFSRYLELSDFQRELSKLRIQRGSISDSELERLERDRILIPRLRLKYPDTVERRWFEENRYGYRPTGRREKDGPRWDSANALEKARQYRNFFGWRDEDPLVHEHPLDAPRTEWRPFIQTPKKRRHIRWQNYRVRVACENDGPEWHSRTVITYYSAWQLLAYLECHEMGTRFYGNTEEWDWPTGTVPTSWSGGGIEFEPIRSMRSFRKFERQLDAIVWFAEEDARNTQYVLRASHARRILEEHEHEEMERRSVILAGRAKSRFRINYPQLIDLIKFLAKRWADWDGIGYQNHSKAYKSFIGQAIHLTRYLKDVPIEQLIDEVGSISGHFKPTLRAIFTDWASEWREDAERVLVGFSQADALVKADFTIEQVNAFLDFVEKNDLFEFYWRWCSLNERAFSGDSNHMAGLKSDLQGMALSVEHIVDALLKGNVQHSKVQLFEKCKQIFPASTEVGTLLLHENEFRQVAYGSLSNILAWFEEKQDGSKAIQIAADISLCHAIRGNAHSPITETNQLKLERLSLILLRGVMRIYLEAENRWFARRD